MSTPDPWTPRHLALSTPRLELRPADEQGLLELVALAELSAQARDELDTSVLEVPNTVADPATIDHASVLHAWTAKVPQPDPASYWHINFLVRHNGKVIGSQTVDAKSFPTSRHVGIGSWVGRAHHGQGFGSEMRTAVLLWAFDHLGAQRAYSHAFADAPTPQAVSRLPGYIETGRWVYAREGAPANLVRPAVVLHTLIRPDWELGLRGHRDPSTQSGW